VRWPLPTQAQLHRAPRPTALALFESISAPAPIHAWARSVLTKQCEQISCGRRMVATSGLRPPPLSVTMAAENIAASKFWPVGGLRTFVACVLQCPSAFDGQTKFSSSGRHIGVKARHREKLALSSSLSIIRRPVLPPPAPSRAKSARTLNAPPGGSRGIAVAVVFVVAGVVALPAIERAQA
jgi:hypothetical protein